MKIFFSTMRSKYTLLKIRWINTSNFMYYTAVLRIRIMQTVTDPERSDTGSRVRDFPFRIRDLWLTRFSYF
jgi:hypothetical protein